MDEALIRYREANVDDVPEMEGIRLPDSEAGPADPRMARYLRREHHPQKALRPRVMYVATDVDAIVGYIGGHLTRRHGCDGELQYLYVALEHRRSGVASGMLRSLWGWFQERDATRICVDVEPDNARARGFYTRHGATDLSSCWLVWTDIRNV
ncbi:MAG: GNAT family N-acetyltransferase [Phycisphaerales bacterium]